MALRPLDIGWMLLVGAATLVANGTPLGNAMGTAAALNALTYNVLQFGVPAVLLLRAADAAVDARRVSAWLAYPAVPLVTVMGGVWVIAPALYPLLGKADWWTRGDDFALANTSFVWHALGVALYVQMRFSLRAQARLTALQARVDPALLSERLGAIDAELADNPPRAQARLAALIELLRALQPHVEAEVSTLAREIVALRAYARLVSADAVHTERLHLAGLADPLDWPLAPMVLLPLARPLLDAAPTFWSLSLQTTAGLAELRLQALGPDAELTRQAAARVPVAELAARLRAVHGQEASLALVADALPWFKLVWPIPTPP
jgi:hypothetical protein